MNKINLYVYRDENTLTHFLHLRHILRAKKQSVNSDIDNLI